MWPQFAQIWTALKAEWRINPFRSFLALLQTIAILLGVGRYLREARVPPPLTFVDVSTLLLQIDTNGTFKGDVMIPADTGPSLRQFKGRVYEVEANTQIQKIREISAFNLDSGQAKKIAQLQVQRLPSQILFCFNGRNVAGAILDQRLLLERDISATYTLIMDKMGIYQSIPDEDLPKQPVCPS